MKRNFDRSRFKSAAAQKITLPADDPVHRRRLAEDQSLPLVLEPTAEGVDVVDWIRANGEQVQDALRSDGAILFRGFDVSNADFFESLASSVCKRLFNENGEHPRETIDGNVYTPTFYPPEHKLLWHNENSFNMSWPTKILFCCVTPAEKGGETPIVDSRKVYDEIDPAVRQRFLEGNVCYMRNYHPGLGLSWQEVFQTSDKSEVERRCREDSVDFEWVTGDRLRTFMRRPAVIDHPQTGEPCWFNQAQHWHISCLDPESRESMQELFSDEELPRNCFYADGSPIADEDMRHILGVYERLEVAFPWQSGDVLLVDNVLCAHARNAFEGARKLLVALGDMCSFSPSWSSESQGTRLTTHSAQAG